MLFKCDTCSLDSDEHDARIIKRTAIINVKLVGTVFVLVHLEKFKKVIISYFLESFHVISNISIILLF